MKNNFAFIQSLEKKELHPQEPEDSLHWKLPWGSWVVS